jgi:hypothetical protein
MVALVASFLALVGAAGVFAGGCNVPNLDETGKTCSGDRCPGGLACVNGRCGGAACATPPPAGGDPCITIPRLTGTQTLDCMPAEFCDVPVKTLQEPSGGATPATVSLQVAWSDVGLHVFVDVKKWPVFPATSANLYTGDAIELFIAASPTYLLGLPTDTSLHFAASPPPPNTGLGGAAQFFAPNLGMTPPPPVPAGVFVGCVVPNVGYDLEIQIPWNLPGVATPPPVAGAKMGYNLGVDVKPETGNLVQSFEDQGCPVPDGGAPDMCTANGLMEAPYCDDRCSCLPTLQ